MELRWAVCLYRVCVRSGGETTVARSQRGSAGRLRCGCRGQPEGQGWQNDRHQRGDDASSPVRLPPRRHGCRAAAATGAGWLLVEMHLQLGADPAAPAGEMVKAGFGGHFGGLLRYVSGFGLYPSPPPLGSCSLFGPRKAWHNLSKPRL